MVEALPQHLPVFFHVKAFIQADQPETLRQQDPDAVGIGDVIDRFIVLVRRGDKTLFRRGLLKGRVGIPDLQAEFAVLPQVLGRVPHHLRAKILIARHDQDKALPRPGIKCGNTNNLPLILPDAYSADGLMVEPAVGDHPVPAAEGEIISPAPEKEIPQQVIIFRDAGRPA